MSAHRWRAALLGAVMAGLRPLAVAVFASVLALWFPGAQDLLELAALAAAAGAAAAMGLALADDLFDPTNPDRLLIEDVSAAGLFHDLVRRLGVWSAALLPLVLVWPRLGYRPELQRGFWFVFRLGVIWQVLSHLVHKRRVVRLVRPEAGTGYALLHALLSRTYFLISGFVIALLGIWGGGYVNLATFLARAGLFTALFLFLAAAGWSLIDRVLASSGPVGDEEEDLGEDLAQLVGPRRRMVTWTTRDIGRTALKAVLASLVLLGLYFAWGGGATGLLILYKGFRATAHIGGLQVSLSRLVTGAFYAGLCLGLSSALRNFLDRKIYPNTPFDRGICHAINTVLHYSLLILAGLLVIETFGVGSETLKWFAGFIGIGVGFGMQTIVNNLASGIILLVERPIKPGDRVQVGTVNGEVTKISVRATTIKDLDNIETIVPNSELIGSSVTNWSYTDANVRLHIGVGVAYGSDVKIVKDGLLKVARNHRLVLRRPQPEVRFLSFGNSSLDFELLVWTRYPFLAPRIQSDLNFAIDAEFRRRDVTIPFPQRDINLGAGFERLFPATAEEADEPEAGSSAPAPSLPSFPAKRGGS